MDAGRMQAVPLITTGVASTIDNARLDSEIRWIVVMHKDCVSVGGKSCEVGIDLWNLLMQKKAV